MSKTIDEKILSGRQYRNMMLECRKAEDGSKSYKVTGYATTFNDPYTLYRSTSYEVIEEIDAHAFDNCDMSDVIMQYDHEGRVFARTSNKTLELKADSRGLLIDADLGGTEIGRQLYEEIDGGYTTKMSFGFVVEEDERTYTEDHETGKYTVHRKITKISKLYDVSAVSLPANDATEISARSFSEGVIAEISEELRKKAEAEAKRKRLELRLKIMEV